MPVSLEERYEIVRHLVDIVVHSEPQVARPALARIAITYRFPDGVQTITDRPAARTFVYAFMLTITEKATAVGDTMLTD